jgi:uncharacterized membrane protein
MIAILAYLTPILFGVGIIIAIVMHGNKKTALGAYHLRQSLGLLLTSLVMWVPLALPLINVLWLFISPIISIALFVFWIMGLIAAINSQQKPLPLIGEHYQKWFAGAFN